MVVMDRRIAAAVALGLALSACSGGSANPNATPGALTACHPSGLLGVGDRLPDCAFRAWDGSVLELTSLRGKPAVLNFWATWCTFCIKEMPDFQTVAREMSGRLTVVGFDLVGVEGEVESAARRFATERGVEYVLAFDEDGLLFSHFAVRPTLPATVLVDAAGRIRLRHIGPLDAAQLRDLIRKHLSA